jgi:hypothetical protein
MKKIVLHCLFALTIAGLISAEVEKTAEYAPPNLSIGFHVDEYAPPNL